jgi:hypothetical protein
MSSCTTDGASLPERLAAAEAVRQADLARRYVLPCSCGAAAGRGLQGVCPLLGVAYVGCWIRPVIRVYTPTSE